MISEKIKIILIEDDEVDYLIVKKAFEEISLVNDLIRFENALSACDYIESGNLDIVPYIILLDLNMPKMNGLEFLEWLRNLAPEKHRNATVVVLTTSNDPMDKQIAFDFCIGGYIVKPVNSKAFIEAMAILGKYWALCELP